MKKWLILFFSIFFIGCGSIKDLSNTPTRKVEAYLNKYQIADDSIFKDIYDDVMDIFNTTDLSEGEKIRYEKMMKKNYGDMTYEVKDERIDGDNAIVTAEINVKDLAKVKENADEYLEDHKEEFQDENGILNDSLFHNYLFEHWDSDSEIITYTIDFTLYKNEDGKWKLDSLTKEQKQKLHGTYSI